RQIRTPESGTMPPAGRISGGSRERLRRQLGHFFVASCLAFACLCGGLQADIKLRIGHNNDTMRDFIAKIFEKYDKSIPPSMYTGKTTIVRVSLMVHAMSSINVIDMDYSVNMFLRQYWNDTRLAYAHRGYNESLTLNSKKSELWVPDLYFINEKRGNFHEITTPNLLLRVKPSGEVTFSQKLTVKLSCNMDLKKFPMDKQKCHLKMESYGYTTHQLLFEWVAKIDERVEFSDDLELPEFVTPPNISTETCVVKYLT
uniref:Gamma-aminobutyric acid receptor subunit beta n=3 Tax=Macrostomum lignano TaxID=282301 RepID=A0A1I8HYA7_9PLAT